MRLERVEGLILHIRDADILDGTPVLDLKPYVAYTDAHPDAGEADGSTTQPSDPVSAYVVEFDALAAEQAAVDRSAYRARQSVSASDRRSPSAPSPILIAASGAWRTGCSSRSRNGVRTSPSTGATCVCFESIRASATRSSRAG